MNPIGYLIAAVGLFALAGRVSDWSWFWNSSRARRVTSALGRMICLNWHDTAEDGTVTDSAGANPTVSVYGPVACGDTTGGPSGFPGVSVASGRRL